ncbi:MAG: M1 family metallopeptidase [Bacteroidetes bacterium]|nr:M1 family metallopeptidase [Bacteroidota bacterium]
MSSRFVLFLSLFFLFFGCAGKCFPTEPGGRSFTTDSLHIARYIIHLDVTDIPGKKIKGQTLITAIADSPSVRGLTLDLLKLVVDSVTISSKSVYYTYNDTTLFVIFPTPLAIADSALVAVYYHGSPIVEPYGWGGFHFGGSTLAFNLGIALEDIPHNYGRVWFPCIDNFTQKAPFDLFIRVKDPLVAVCGGMLKEVSPLGDGTRIFHWQLLQKIPPYLVSVAVSDYVPVKGMYNGINGNIPTYIYVRAKDTTRARNSFIHLNQAMAVFEKRFGPYRWPRVGYVATTEGAMEHATNIAYPATSIDGTLLNEWFYAHELSHMWFGELVTCQTPEDMWINEGWAVFCEGIFMENIYGNEAAAAYRRTKHHDVLRFTHLKDGNYYPLSGIPQNLTYGNTVYEKGALVVNTMRGYMGDSLFFRTVKQYVDSFAFRCVSSSQMRDFFSRSLIPGFFHPDFLIFLLIQSE